MKTLKVRFLLLALLVTTIGIGGYFVGRSYVFSRLGHTVIQALDSLRQKGIDIQYISLETDSWEKNLVLRGLEVKFHKNDTLCYSRASIPRIELKGLSLLALLLHRELAWDEILLDHPALYAMNNFKSAKWNTDRKEFLNSLRIGFLRIDSGTFEVMDSTKCEILTTLKMNLDFRDLSARRGGDRVPAWSVVEATVSDLSANLPTQFYKLTIKKATLCGLEKGFQIDSLNITPLFDRNEFAKKSGRQIDQFTIEIPLLLATGFEVTSSSLTAQRVDVGFRLEAFRDKRVPRKERSPTMLPVSFLRQLPVGLRVDTLVVSESYASYEEIPEGGEAPGKIFFNGLHGTIANLSNTSDQGAWMSLQTQFMNAGDLKAEFTFPIEPQKPYSVKGSLSGFSIPGINAMLVPVAHVEVESGEMQQLKFHFQYNEYRSDGQVELSYTNLKVRRLKTDGDQSEKKFISFLINMFVRNDLDKTDSKEERTGTIERLRDPQRGIFNYWWKSLFSGIKSVFVIGGKSSDKKRSNTHEKKKRITSGILSDTNHIDV